MINLPNPFAASDAAAEQAVASIPCPHAQDGAADLSDSGDADCPPDDTAAPLRQADAAAVELPDDISCIGEIFVGARKLNLPPFKLDVPKFMFDIGYVPPAARPENFAKYMAMLDAVSEDDPPPVFLRRAG